MRRGLQRNQLVFQRHLIPFCYKKQTLYQERLGFSVGRPSHLLPAMYSAGLLGRKYSNDVAR